MGSCLTLPNRFGRSALGGFVRTTLGVFGSAVPVDFVEAYASTFKVRIELDKIEIHDFGGSQIGSLNLANVTRVVLNRHNELLLSIGFLLGPLRSLDRIGSRGLRDGSPPPFAVLRSGIDPAHLTTITEIFGEDIRTRAVYTTTPTQAVFSFDTASTSLRYLWRLADENSEGPLRGYLVRYFQLAGNENILAWHWPASENPTFTLDGIEFRHFGRIIYESDDTVAVQGLAHLMNMYLRQNTGNPIGPRNWRVGFYEASKPVAASTAAVPLFTEFVDYVGQRPGIGGGPVVSVGDGTASIVRSNSPEVDVNATGSVKGSFWATEVPKLSTSGFLWGGNDFASPISVKSGDTVTAAYTINAETNDSFGSP